MNKYVKVIDIMRFMQSVTAVLAFDENGQVITGILPELVEVNF